MDEEVGNSFVERYKCKTERESELVEQLKLVKCSFTWVTNTLNGTEVTITHKLAKFNKKINKELSNLCEPDISISRIFNFIQLGYFKALDKEWEIVQKYFDYLIVCYNDPSMKDISEGLKHVVNGNKAFVWLLMGEYDRCDEQLLDIPKYDDLHPRCKACVMVIHGASLIDIGIDGSRKGLDIFRQAITLDETYSEWHFRLGFALLRIRHSEYDIKRLATLEECQALERASDLAPDNVDIIVYLAQSFHERDDTEENQSHSRVLYDKALELNPESVHVNIRCGKGYRCLKPPYRDLVIAEKCIVKALSLEVDNPAANHEASIFYEYSKKDLHKALEYLENINKLSQENIYAAAIRLVDLKTYFDGYESWDPIGQLMKMENVYKDFNYQLNDILCLRGLFWYVKHGNVLEATADWYLGWSMQAEKFKREFKHLRVLRCFKKHQVIQQKWRQLPDDLVSLLHSNNFDSSMKPFLELLLDLVKQMVLKLGATGRSVSSNARSQRERHTQSRADENLHWRN